MGENRLLDLTFERIRKLEEAIQHLRERVEQLENKQTQRSGTDYELTKQEIDEIDLMNLPTSLRRTMIAVVKLKEGTPEEVSELTKRTRGLENLYLNHLEMLGYVEKSKKGRRVYYRSLRVI